MPESERKISRREFLKQSLFGAGSPYLQFFVAEEDRRNKKEIYRFSDKPLLHIDFSKMKDSNSMDPRYWNYDIGTTIGSSNGEAQTYTRHPSNVRVQRGQLIIQGKKEYLDERYYTSGRINMKGKFDVLYGKFNIVAKMPKGEGTWPAIWLRVSNPPDSINSGEIDIVEAQGARPGVIFSNCHTRETKDNPINPYQGMLRVPDSAESFHNYGVEWTPDQISFSVDEKRYHSIIKKGGSPYEWPFDQKYHLVANLALGGKWATSLSDRLNLGLVDGINDMTEEGWILSIRSLSYYPLLQ